MKRKLLSRQRVAGVAIGLVAGWYAAGIMPSTALAAGSAVEGTWTVTCSPDSDAKSNVKEMKITLVFKPAEFSVTEWVKKGYKPAAYETDERRFGPAKFDGTLESKEEGKAVFTGQANSGQLTGTLTMTKKNGDEVKYTLQGERTAKK